MYDDSCSTDLVGGTGDNAVDLMATLRAVQPRCHSLIPDRVSRCFLQDAHTCFGAKLFSSSVDTEDCITGVRPTGT
jgi:hypothetical protein